MTTYAFIQSGTENVEPLATVNHSRCHFTVCLLWLYQMPTDF